jgi:hypothetical protein
MDGVLVCPSAWLQHLLSCFCEWEIETVRGVALMANGMTPQSYPRLACCNNNADAVQFLLEVAQ